MPRLIAIVVCAAGSSMLMISCIEERVVAVRGPANLPGAEGGTRVDSGAEPPPSRTWDQVLGESLPTVQGEPVKGKPFRFQKSDRSIVLQSHSPRQLFIHLGETLMSDEDDLLYEQVLSEELKSAYAARGMDPRESVSFLTERRDDVLRFLALFPLGEQTPGVTMQPLGRGAFRMSAPGGGGGEGQTFRSIDVVFERGGFRLLMLN